MKLRTRKKETTQTETHVLLLSYFLFFLIFIGVWLCIYFLYIETWSIIWTVLAWLISILIISLIFYWLFTGGFKEKKYSIKPTKKSLSTFLTILSIIIVSVVTMTPFILLWIYEHKAFLFFVFMLISPILYEMRNRLLLHIRKNTLFQKVDDILLASKYLKNSNFLNHHNYFKNYELETNYSRYKKMKIIKFIVRNIFIILFLIWASFIFPQLMLEFIIWPILLFVVIILLITKDNASKMKDDYTVKIYFRRIQATAFQKIKNTIFFY